MDSPHFALLTARGKDHVGLVALVGAFLARHGANIEGCWTLRRRRQLYQMTFHIAASSARMRCIKAAYALALANLQPRLSFLERPRARRRHELSLITVDQAGLIAETTHLISFFGGSILDLRSMRFLDADPQGKSRVRFALHAIVDFGSDFDQLALTNALRVIADTRLGTVSWRPWTPAADDRFPPSPRSWLGQQNWQLH